VSRSVKAHLLLVLATLVWGVTFVQIKFALEEASPLAFNTLRMTLAAGALLIAFRKDMLRLTRGALAYGILVGTFLWAGYEFQTTGLTLTTPSKSAFLTGVSVVLVPVFLALFWRRAVNRWTTLGVAAALAGLYLMTVPASHTGTANWASINRGDVLTMGCAVAFAFQIIFMGRAMQRFPFQQVATLQALTAALLMALTVPVLERPQVSWTPNVIAAILVTGLLGTAAAFAVQAWAQQFTPPTHTALIFSLEPVFAWITSYLVLGERLGRRATLGACLILAGVLLSELKGTVSEKQELELEVS
jgi:drug/metabolite transporter (DMT)-like permease